MTSSGLESRRAAFLSDLFASIVVFLVALPLCMGIAIASGAPVSAGLITGIVAGIVVGSIAGCPLQVSGPAAGLTVIVFDCIQRFGLERLGLIVLVAGLLQIVAGLLRLGQWFRAVSPAVVKGMLAGIGVLILASQFHVMLDDQPRGGGLANLQAIPESILRTFRGASLRGASGSVARQRLAIHITELGRRQKFVRDRLAARLPAIPAEARSGPSDKLRDLAELQRKAAAELAEVRDERERLPPEDQASVGDAFEPALAAASAAASHAADALQRGDAVGALDSLGAADQAVRRVIESLKKHELAALVGVVTILVLMFWKKIGVGKLKLIPAPLAAVLIATIFAALWRFPVVYVEVPDSLLGEIHLPTWALIADSDWKPLLQAALLLSTVASAETLLSANAVDQLQSGPRTKYDRELFAQGVGNLLCGICGALPMTGVIVRSSANVQSGAKTRLSAVLHGCWLLLFVSQLAFLLRWIPTSCLAGILVFTGFKLVDVKAWKDLRQYGWGEVIVYLATIVTIVSVDLLSGVIVGLVLAVAKLLYAFSHLEATLELQDDGRRAILRLTGAATFVRLPQLAACLEKVPAGAELHAELSQLDYLDHACFELLWNWERQHEATGGKLVIDWGTLQALVRSTPAQRKN